jgi:hypothetical protein
VILLAGAALAALLYLLMTPAVTGRAPTAFRPIPPEAWTPVLVAPVPVYRPLRRPEPPAGLQRPAPTPTPRPKPTVRPFVIPAHPTVADAKAYALATLGPVQYDCLNTLINRESHWNPFDLNRSSGAYGIPQALPGSKMAWAGSDWRWNPVTQVKWMILRYIPGRYGTACNALAHSYKYGWY